LVATTGFEPVTPSL